MARNYAYLTEKDIEALKKLNVPEYQWGHFDRFLDGLVNLSQKSAAHLSKIKDDYAITASDDKAFARIAKNHGYSLKIITDSIFVKDSSDLKPIRVSPEPGVDFESVCRKMDGQFKHIQGIQACEIDGMRLGYMSAYSTLGEKPQLNIKSANLKVSVHIKDPKFSIEKGKLRITDENF